MYSQNNEEKFITSYFSEKVGKFMDIGAYHPFKFSNTRKLYEIGWSGIYVEPSPICYGNFVEQYANDERITLINKAVVASDEKLIDFYEANGDAVSTRDEGHKHKWQNSGAKYNKILVEAINIADLLSIYPDINFLNIDVESMNYELFMAIPNDVLRSIDMLCIEHDNWFHNIEGKMIEFGFEKLLLNSENIILAKKKI